MRHYPDVIQDRSPAPLRDSLVDAAARLLVSEGPAALTLRRLADEVGTSTMAIYTHFGGMPQLRRALRREGFDRLRAQLDGVAATYDAVADLALQGLVYRANATGNADLYRVMCMEEPLDADDATFGSETFVLLVAGVERCIEAGRFHGADATGTATQLWVLAHGISTLELAGLLDVEQALRTFRAAALNLFAAYGDDRDAASRSLDAAWERLNAA